MESGDVANVLWVLKPLQVRVLSLPRKYALANCVYNGISRGWEWLSTILAGSIPGLIPSLLSSAEVASRLHREGRGFESLSRYLRSREARSSRQAHNLEIVLRGSNPTSATNYERQ